MKTSESDTEVNPNTSGEKNFETKSAKSKSTKVKPSDESKTLKSKVPPLQSASSSGNESEYELSVAPAKFTKTKPAAEPKISKFIITTSENEAENQPSPPPVKPAPKSMRIKAEPKTSKSVITTSENEAENEPSHPPVRPASKSMKTRAPAESKTSKSAVPAPSAVTSVNEDDVSPPRAKPAPKSKAKMPVEAKSKMPPPRYTTSDYEVEEESSHPPVKAVTKTKPKTAKGKATVSKTPAIPRNTPQNEEDNIKNTFEPKASTSKASTSTGSISKTTRTENTDDVRDEKMQKASTSEMVTAALVFLPSRKGTSLVAIKKYINEHYTVDMKKFTKIINNYLKKNVEAGNIIQLTGKGASGSFKLPKPEKKSAKPNKAKVEKEKTVKLNKKAKIAIVSTPKRRSFKVVSSKRKSMSVLKATKPKNSTGDTRESESIEKETKPAAKIGKTMKSSAKTIKADEIKPKKGTRSKKK